MATKKNITKIDNKLILVIWHDAHADSSGTWVEKENIGSNPYIVETCGFLIEGVKPNHVTIAQTISHDGMYDHIIHIPDAMVVSKKTISTKSDH